jgi:hypothetical protein
MPPGGDGETHNASEEGTLALVPALSSYLLENRLTTSPKPHACPGILSTRRHAVRSDLTAPRPAATPLVTVGVTGWIWAFQLRCKRRPTVRSWPPYTSLSC